MILTVIGVISHGNDAHWLLRDVGTQHFHVSSCVLVSSKDGPPHPVSPEDVVSIHSQAKRVDRLVLQQDLKQKIAAMISQTTEILSQSLDGLFPLQLKEKKKPKGYLT